MEELGARPPVQGKPPALSCRRACLVGVNASGWRRWVSVRCLRARAHAHATTGRSCMANNMGGEGGVFRNTNRSHRSSRTTRAHAPTSPLGPRRDLRSCRSSGPRRPENGGGLAPNQTERGCASCRSTVLHALVHRHAWKSVESRIRTVRARAPRKTCHARVRLTSPFFFTAVLVPVPYAIQYCTVLEFSRIWTLD